jgi:hypothetical protein
MYVPVLLSAAIVEKLELIWACCRRRVETIGKIHQIEVSETASFTEVKPLKVY